MLVACVVGAWLAGASVAGASPPGGTTAFRADEAWVVPAPGSNLLNLHTTDTLASGWPSFASVVSLTRNAVTLTADGPVESTVVQSRAGVTLLAAVGILERLEIGLTLPFTLATDGEPLTPLGRPDEVVAGSAMGDLAATIKVRVFDPKATGGVGLAVGLTLALPTGDERTFDSYGALVGRPFVVADWRARRGGPVVACEVGYAFLPRVVAGDVVIDDALSWGVGVRFPEVVGDLSVLTTLSGRLPAVEWSSAVVPVEADLGLELRFGPFVAFAAAGVGLHGDVGAPALRLLAGFGYTPIPRDDDRDGLDDTRDGCPHEAEDADGFEDGDGCPDPDNDADGVPDASDGAVDGSGLGRCRDVPEDVDGFEDSDGCPEPDNDQDGFPDELDPCPNQPDTGSGTGCPGAAPAP